MLKPILILSALACAVSAHAQQLDATQMAAARAKAQVCFACHGPDGNSTVGEYPILAGQSWRYIYIELKDFKEGRRSDEQMSPVAEKLSTDDMMLLGEFFAAQKQAPIKFQVDPGTRERVIDWSQTRAIYLQMHNIYLYPQGLGGDWKRASGAEYDKLRRRVRQLLAGLVDSHGVKPVVEVVDWEQARRLRLRPERVGDLIIANRAGYGWSEEVTTSGEIFHTPLVSGYKQAIPPKSTRGLWTPFVIVGPGIRRGHFLGDQPIELVDEYPTLLCGLGASPAKWVQGRAVRAAFENK